MNSHRMNTQCAVKRYVKLLTLCLAMSIVVTGESMALAQQLPAAKYPNSKILVDPEGLISSLKSAKILLLDVRKADAYDKEHIPGAVWLDIESWSKQSKLPMGLADKKAWSNLAGDLGATIETRIVVYDDSITPNVARAWWLLRYLGVQEVAILNGGVKAWTACNGPLDAAKVNVSSQAFEPKFQTELLAQKDLVNSMLDSSSACLVDSRSGEEFTGEKVQGVRGGRIPHAKHLEWKQFLDDNGRFKSADALEQLITPLKIGDDQVVVTYCQSGGRAALDAFAFELMGHKNVKNYYGSFGEWSADEKLPVEKD